MMANRTTMNVSVTPEIEQFVQSLVATGRYHSASEVFCEGLRLLEQIEQQRLLEKWLLQGLTVPGQTRLPAELLNQVAAQFRAMVQEGLDAARCGELLDGDTVFQKLIEHRRKRRKASA